VWLAGLKALIGKNHNRRTRSNISDVSYHFNICEELLLSLIPSHE
jgi:hypothetical protein